MNKLESEALARVSRETDIESLKQIACAGQMYKAKATVVPGNSKQYDVICEGNSALAPNSQIFFSKINFSSKSQIRA